MVDANRPCAHGALDISTAAPDERRSSLSRPSPPPASALDPGAGPGALFEALVARTSDAVALATSTRRDPAIRFRHANEAFVDLFGHDADELVGRMPDLLVGPETDLEALRRMEAALRSSATATEDLVLHHQDGRALSVRASWDRISADDETIWYLAVLRDLAPGSIAPVARWRADTWAQALVDAMTDLIVVLDDEGSIRWCSPSVETRLGWDPADLEGVAVWDLLHPDDLATAAAEWARVLEGRVAGGPAELRVRTRDGSWRVLRLQASDLRQDPVVGAMVVSADDVTERAWAQDLLTEHADLLEIIARGAPLDVTLQKIALMIERRLPGVHISIGVTTPDGIVRNRAAPTLSWDVVAALDDVMADQALTEGVPAGGWRRHDLGARGPGDPMRPAVDAGLVECRSAVLRSPGAKEQVGALSVFLEPTAVDDQLPAELLERSCNLAAIAIERQRFEAALEHRANYDDLTGLPNRSLLQQRVDASLRRAHRHDHGVAVLFVDLDRFRVVNDSVGHVLGDRLLHAVTVRLTDGLRPGDTLGRFGGDEFMIVCNRVASETDAVTVADRILRSLTAPFDLGLPSGPVVLTASIGIAVALDAGIEPAELIRNADVAMSRAKDQGRNRYAVYDRTQDLRRVERLSLEQALRTAIDEDQLEVHYQPIVRLADGCPTHVEALVRWQRPGVGLVPPTDFIAVAEDSGLIVPLGWQVLERACAEAAAWAPPAAGPPVGVAVNLSARQLGHADLPARVAGTLEATGLDPARLSLEVTESSLVHDTEQVKAALEEIKGLGVRVAIDDFGTGYATLDYLRQFSMADELKIDRSFIDGVELDGSREQAIVAAAVSIGSSLGVAVVAEGVETDEQAHALAELGVELAQGYLFSRPLPAHEAVARFS